jgi:DNA polymerase
VDRKQLAEHLRFFQELGVDGISRNPSWRRRNAGGGPGTAGAAAGTGIATETPESPSPPVSTRAVQAVAAPAAVDVPGQPISIARSEREVLEAIRADLGECTRCKLHGLGRTQIVFGVGNPAAELMFVGEAPGADEDQQGEPFVGRAGQLLTRMIEGGMGLARDQVYIANVLKCRPPGNRNPELDEVLQCEPFLFRQIASIRPKVIVALGAFAARALLKSNDPISRLRGRIYEFQGARLIPTFHPSFLLRSPGFKREAWEDLKKALALLGRQPPPAATRQP